MPIMQDANGNPVIVTVDQLLQRAFNSSTDSIRTDGTRADSLKKFASIPSGQFTVASTTYQFWYDKVLRNTARERILTIQNNFQPGGANIAVKILLYDYDSVVQVGDASKGNPNTNTADAGNPRKWYDTSMNLAQQLSPGFYQGGSWATFHSRSTVGNTMQLAAPGDSVLLILSSSTTLPTSGTMDFYMKEFGTI